MTLAGMTRHPTEAWMIQMARNAVDETSGCLCNHRYLLHDRDAKFCAEFDDVLRSGGVHCLTLPPRSPITARRKSQSEMCRLAETVAGRLVPTSKA